MTQTRANETPLLGGTFAAHTSKHAEIFTDKVTTNSADTDDLVRYVNTTVVWIVWTQQFKHILGFCELES